MAGYQAKDDLYEKRNTDGFNKNQENYELLEAGMAYNAGTRGEAVYDMERALRMGFIRKVYGILSLQLLLTAAVATVCVLCDPVRSYILHNVWAVFLGAILSIIVLVALMCFRDKYPMNMYLLVLWTFLEAYMVGVVCAAYATVGQGFVVVQAATLTMAVFLGLTLFTFQTKIDFSFLGGALFASLWIMFIWGFIMLVFGFRQSYLYSLAGAIIFSLFILYDTSLLMNKLGYDEYIVASINLYLDIINLFLYILRLLSNRNNS